MFLRRYERRKNGKRHTYWALVESIRTARGSRQKIVAYLGELKKSERNGWAQLGRRMDRKNRPSPTLFDPPHNREPEDDVELVRIKGVQLERMGDFGNVWLGLGLWRLLELDKLLAKLMPSGREEVDWPIVAAILTMARFCEASSELHIADTWYRRTALEDLLGVPAERVHTRRLYEGLDALLPHKEELEKHLKDRLGNLFDLKYDLLLYDITSTYFEGQCAGNPMAKHGYSRDYRSDCLQVCIGLVVTEEGMPLGFGAKRDHTRGEDPGSRLAYCNEGLRLWLRAVAPKTRTLPPIQSGTRPRGQPAPVATDTPHRRFPTYEFDPRHQLSAGRVIPRQVQSAIQSTSIRRNLRETTLLCRLHSLLYWSRHTFL